MKYMAELEQQLTNATGLDGTDRSGYFSSMVPFTDFSGYMQPVLILFCVVFGLTVLGFLLTWLAEKGIFADFVHWWRRLFHTDRTSNRFSKISTEDYDDEGSSMDSLGQEYSRLRLNMRRIPPLTMMVKKQIERHKQVMEKKKAAAEKASSNRDSGRQHTQNKGAKPTA